MSQPERGVARDIATHTDQTAAPTADHGPVRESHGIRHTLASWAWILYLIFTIVMVLGTVKGVFSNPWEGWGVSLAAGAYTFYLFAGGRHVIVSAWVMLAPLLLIPILYYQSSHTTTADASMTCSDFMALGRSERANIADQLYTDKNGQSSTLGGTSALLNIEYTCNGNPDKAIGDAL